MAELPSFTLPAIFDNPKGWGPANSPSGAFRDIPYIPFSKGDKVTRVANWISPADSRETNQRGNRRQQRDQGQQAYGSSSASAFAYTVDADEESFSLVDKSGSALKKIAVRAMPSSARGAPHPTGGMQRLGNYGGRAGGGQKFQGGGFRRRFGWRDGGAPQKDASVKAGADWVEIQEIQFNRMRDLSFGEGEPEELGRYGVVGIWDHTLDRVNTRLERTLTAAPKARLNVSASDDPVLAQLAESDPRIRVLATDSVVAALMAATVSNSAWDIVVNRSGNKVFLDKRDGGPLDYAPVNESAVPPPAVAVDGKDTAGSSSINGASMLAQEARNAERSLLAQATAAKQTKLEHSNPFLDESTTTDANAYRYRAFNMASEGAEEPCLMAVRTELGVLTADSNPRQLFVRALTQHDITAPGAGGVLDWRLRLDAQRGAVMATEMKNNTAKLARWAFQALVSGADQIKFGFVARQSPKNNTRHTVLGFQSYKPGDFITQMGLNEFHAWGIVKALVDLCLNLEEGKYVIMRDPNNPLIRIYSVPAGTFEDNGDESVKDDGADEE
ncbi:hypothetical protein GGI07_000238 [Coemansia sp. Benny D115]|nr:hypothetical protein GGI07_000238 [Coemansia sp. Benny D115]